MMISLRAAIWICQCGCLLWWCGMVCFKVYWRRALRAIPFCERVKWVISWDRVCWVKYKGVSVSNAMHSAAHFRGEKGCLWTKVKAYRQEAWEDWGWGTMVI